MAYVHVHPARSMNYQLEIFVEDEHEGFYFLYSLGMQIFLDMAALVDAQGDVLDRIELNGSCALQKAKKLQRNSRKWMCIAIIILLITVVIIVVTVIKPWNNNKGA
ncbi:hypothetical protein D5086_024409 [Populus alba]|uniref:Uncharacterized protein n=2 Tax=Populus TaxID=3689 RepID=A0ACC4B633_POPAL|nr:syntaxin-132-like [Populus alba]KAJ6974894.1 syntaxin-132-like [Populus alba x Populus x berolinensis]